MNFQFVLDEGLQAIADGDDERALTFLAQADSLDPMNAELNVGWGIIWLRKNSLDEAARRFDEALKVRGDDHDALFYRGVLEMQKQNWPGAIKFFEKNVASHPFSFKTYHQLGICLGHLKYFSAAIDSIKKSLSLYPSAVDAQIDLAILLCQSGKIGESINLLQEAIRQNPLCKRAQLIAAEIQKVGASR